MALQGFALRTAGVLAGLCLLAESVQATVVLQVGLQRSLAEAQTRVVSAGSAPSPNSRLCGLDEIAGAYAPGLPDAGLVRAGCRRPAPHPSPHPRCTFLPPPP